MAERVKDYVLKGSIIYSKSLKELSMTENGYAVCVNGQSEGVFEELPGQYKDLPLYDYEDDLIIPGLVDLHVHAPQYGMRGFGMDLELLDWLNTYTFPREAEFASPEFARKAYGMFVEDLKNSGTTHASIFATIHSEAALILMELLEEAGVHAYVGKVNMDRNAPDFLREETKRSIQETREWIQKAKNKFQNVKPIITPRFIPTCTDELMRGLQGIQEEYEIPVQSHLSENRGEIQWVKELCPQAATYGHAYEQFGMMGGEVPTIMAHCVSSEDEEITLMRENKVFVAHCPESNLNIASGIAPVRRYLEEGIPMGLGSDVAGGNSLSIFRAMSCAIQSSKMYWRYVDESCAPLTVEEAFFLGTKGGGAFFGKVGSFEKGYEFAPLIIEDRKIKTPLSLNLRERLERTIYLSDERHINSFIK